MIRRWEQIAADFHERVKSNCWDSLAGQLLRLHEPHLVDGEPVCWGCDRERGDQGGTDPVWPCRTYTIIASAMLKVQDIEATLDRMHKLAVTAGVVATPSRRPRPSRSRSAEAERGPGRR